MPNASAKVAERLQEEGQRALQQQATSAANSEPKKLKSLDEYRQKNGQREDTQCPDLSRRRTKYKQHQRQR
jgi:hypothetical protein